MLVDINGLITFLSTVQVLGIGCSLPYLREILQLAMSSRRSRTWPGFEATPLARSVGSWRPELK